MKRTFIIEWGDCGIETSVMAKNEEEAISEFKNHLTRHFGVTEVNDDSIKRVYELK